MMKLMKANKIFITPEEVYQYLQDDSLDVVLLDMPYGKHEYIKDADEKKRKFEDAHLPGARHIVKEEVDDAEHDLNIRDAESIRDVFLAKGVTKDTLVITYSDGIIASARIALIAYWLGVQNVKIMAGNLKNWEDLGYPLAHGKEEKLADPPAEFGCPVPGRPGTILLTPADVMAKKENDPQFVLASLRSVQEFTGNDTGYSYVKDAGTPCDSAYAKGSTHRTNVEEIIDDEGHWGNTEEILASWEKNGLTKDKHIAFFCGAGWRAAIGFFFALEQGYPHVAVYDGGWYQWLKYYHQDPKKYAIEKGKVID